MKIVAYLAAGLVPPIVAWAVGTRTSGNAPFYAYGVLNDEKISDGSVVGGVAR